MTEEEAQQLKPGQRVSYSGSGKPEYGIIVCTWLLAEDIDCYVALFGTEWPTLDKQPAKPYILRYYGTSLDLELELEDE